MLATAAVLRIDRHARRAIVASAGHPPVIHSRAGHTTFIELFAPPLGVRLEHDVPSRSIEIETGDVFVLHSDGVYESQNADGEIFGLDRLAALVAKHGDQHAEAIRDAIIGELEAFRDGGAQRDDVTIVVARIAAGQASAGV